MKSQNPYKKFHVEQAEVQLLLEKNSKFKRMYDEYDQLSDNLWNLEQVEGASITDDFLNYIKVQTTYLENELQDCILSKPSVDF